MRHKVDFCKSEDSFVFLKIMKFLKLRYLVTILSLSVLSAQAADEPADAFIRQQSAEVFNALKADPSLQSGDLSKMVLLVDNKIMPNVNFKRMTASAVGPAWRQATPEQQKRLQDEFKTLLVRTYAGALTQVGDLSVVVRPLRASPEDNEVIVRTEIRGQSNPVQLDYRLEKAPGEGSGWKIFNLNVMGIWLVETYRNQFAQVISANGLEGLISALANKNKVSSKKG
jgi:phospholipid transport system substrate-binding protein